MHHRPHNLAISTAVVSPLPPFPAPILLTNTLDRSKMGGVIRLLVLAIRHLHGRDYMANQFRFDPALSPQANIDLFFAHLETLNPEMTKLLADNIGNMLPFPDGQTRTTLRTQFNRNVATALAQPAKRKD